MYCPRCGSLNNDTATVCSNCGTVLPTAAPAGQPTGSQVPPSGMPGYGETPRLRQPMPPQIPSYLWQAIAVTVCCCVPFGIVAIIKAADVGTKLALQDYAGALESSNAARFWCWIGLGAGLLFVSGYILLVIAGVITDPAWEQSY